MTGLLGDIELAERRPLKRLRSRCAPTRRRPPGPIGWLVATARNRVDQIRRPRVPLRPKLLASDLEFARRLPCTTPVAIPDDGSNRSPPVATALRLDALVALTLRTLGGLSTRRCTRLRPSTR
jgi:RNA polymerase sigma-70 factor (ECF subfamily)